MLLNFSSIFLILLFFPIPVWAATLSAEDLKAVVDGLTNSEAQQLASKGQVTRFFEANSSPRLIPDCSLTNSVQKRYASIDHAIGVEALFVMNTGTGSLKSQMLRWYNVLRSISTMKGMKYYSVTHGRVRVLFRDSYAINNVKDQRPLPDPLVSTIPSESDLTIKQDDSTFGEVLFHLHYRSVANAISMSMLNLNTLYLWFIPVIGENHMVLQLVLLPYKGHLLFYGGVEVKTISLFGLQNATRDSFTNRVEALHRWFQDAVEQRQGAAR